MRESFYLTWSLNKDRPLTPVANDGGFRTRPVQGSRDERSPTGAFLVRSNPDSAPRSERILFISPRTNPTGSQDPESWAARVLRRRHSSIIALLKRVSGTRYNSSLVARFQGLGARSCDYYEWVIHFRAQATTNSTNTGWHHCVAE